MTQRVKSADSELEKALERHVRGEAAGRVRHGCLLLAGSKNDLVIFSPDKEKETRGKQMLQERNKLLPCEVRI